MISAYKHIPTFQLLIPIAIALISLIISGYVGYSNDTKAIAVRVKGIEVQQQNDGSRLERIENKLDRLLALRP